MIYTAFQAVVDCCGRVAYNLPKIGICTNYSVFMFLGSRSCLACL